MDDGLQRHQQGKYETRALSESPGLDVFSSGMTSPLVAKVWNQFRGAPLNCLRVQIGQSPVYLVPSASRSLDYWGDRALSEGLKVKFSRQKLRWSLSDPSSDSTWEIPYVSQPELFLYELRRLEGPYMFTHTHTHTHIRFSTANIPASSLSSPWQPVCQGRSASLDYLFLSHSLTVVLGSSRGCRLADSVADGCYSPDKAGEREVASQEITINTGSHILIRY